MFHCSPAIDISVPSPPSRSTNTLANDLLSRVLLRPFICPYHPLYPYRTTSVLSPSLFPMLVTRKRLYSRGRQVLGSIGTFGASRPYCSHHERTRSLAFPGVNSSFSPPSPRLVLAYQYHVQFYHQRLYDSSCLSRITQHCGAMATIATLGDDRTDLRLGL